MAWFNFPVVCTVNSSVRNRAISTAIRVLLWISPECNFLAPRLTQPSLSAPGPSHCSGALREWQKYFSIWNRHCVRRKGFVLTKDVHTSLYIREDAFVSQFLTMQTHY